MLKLKNIALVCMLTIFGLSVQAQEKDNYPTKDEDKKDNRELSETQDDPMMEDREDQRENREEYREDLREDREDLREHQLEEREELREDQRETREERMEDRQGQDRMNQDKMGQNQMGQTKNQNQQNYGQIEQTQDEIEQTQFEIYAIVEQHPDFTYKYDFQDNTVTAVNIEGVEDKEQEQKLERQLLQLAELRQQIRNQSTRTGIYYVSEKEPKPKEGYDELYEDLYAGITYPEAAERDGVEGNIYAKFIVDHEGNVEHVVTTVDVEPTDHFAVEEMKEEVKKAVKNTSGEWEPAKIGGVAVSQWVVLPVQFKVKTPPSLEPLVMDLDENNDY